MSIGVRDTGKTIIETIQEAADDTDDSGSSGRDPVRTRRGVDGNYLLIYHKRIQERKRMREKEERYKKDKEYR